MRNTFTLLFLAFFVQVHAQEDSTGRRKADSLKLFLQPVEVKALRAGEKAPFTKTDLSKKEIEALNVGQDLPFLLNQTPSVVINSDAGNGVGYTAIYIRGTDDSRINMTLNGIPYNDAEEQAIFFVDRSEEHTSELQSPA